MESTQSASLGDILLRKSSEVKCPFFDHPPRADAQVVTMDSARFLLDDAPQVFKDKNLIFQSDEISLDDIALLLSIKSMVPSASITVCTDAANLKYRELITRLNFDFKIVSEGDFCNCRLGSDVGVLVSSWLYSSCADTSSPYSARVIALISEDFRNASLMNLSKELNLSTEYLSRVIRRDFKVTFRSLVNKLKLYVCEELVKRHGCSAEELAEFLGYTETNNFERFFRKTTGETFARHRSVTPGNFPVKK